MRKPYVPPLLFTEMTLKTNKQKPEFAPVSPLLWLCKMVIEDW